MYVNYENSKYLKIPVTHSQGDVVMPEIRRNNKLIIAECVCNVQENFTYFPANVDSKQIFDYPIKVNLLDNFVNQTKIQSPQSV